MTEKLLTAADVFTSAMAAGYRDEQTRRLLREESERSALVDALLHGRLLQQWSLWEVADYLRLPNGGPYVVIAAETPVVGAEPLPDIESKLRSLDVFSAWRLLPDLQVGIVHVNSDKHREDVLALLSRMSKQRVGVSARFDDLRDTAQALRDARVAIRGRPDPGVLVSAFDGSILATAAVSAPEVMTKLVAPTLDSFAGMADDERDVLFETFRVWVENDGSLAQPADCCFAIPTLCGTDCTESSNEPGARCPGRETSPNSAWRWKYTAALCSRILGHRSYSAITRPLSTAARSAS